MNIKYRVDLSQAEREELEAMLSGGRHAARKLKRAQILLAAHDGVGDAVIAATLRSADRPSIGPNAASWKRTSKARSARNRAPAPHENYRASKRRCWWPPLVRAAAGTCALDT